MSELAASECVPGFLRQLASPDVETVFVAGCGGGFDFVHGLLLYPLLRSLGKEVVVGSCSFGDPEEIGGEAPVVFEHGVDAVVIVDGGSDSLMRGDEEGLGDPIEDHVSDASALRAIPELTRMGGFLGAMAIEPSSASFRFYRDLVHYVFEHQRFHSVLAGAIAAAGEGHFGAEVVPDLLERRVKPGDLFLGPLMASSGDSMPPRWPSAPSSPPGSATRRPRRRAIRPCSRADEDG